MVKELKATFVGIFIIVGVIVFVVLYTWFSGRLGLRNTYDLVVMFDDVVGLRIGDPVMVYGMEKGKVKDMKIDQNKIKSILAIDRNIMIPEDSKISIKSISMLGADRYVKIEPGLSDKTASVYHGSTGGFDLEALGNQLDSLMLVVKNFKLGDFDLNKIASKLTRDMNRSLETLTEAIKAPSEKIEHLAIRLDSLTALLSGDGTIGKLMKSDELYEEVRQTNQALKNLIEDIKENPDRYINIKVF